MKDFVRKAVFAVLMAAAVMSVSGCLSIKADELYSLPQASEEYLKLQAQINAVLKSGAEFSPPTGGENRQSVQTHDLDGNGVNEVIAFFSIPGDSSLKAYIFVRTEDDYAVADIIEGVGTAVESVRYVDMDGDGVKELVAGWQIESALQHMTIYSLKNFQNVRLADADYNTLEVCDLNGDGNDEVVALRLKTPETNGVAEVFALMPDGEMVSGEAQLSGGIETISRILTGELTNGVPAMFIDCKYKYTEGSLITDICAYRDGVFSNVTADGRGGVSRNTVRAPSYYSADINRDSVVEVPMPRQLKAQSDTAYYVLDWYAYSSFGVSRLAMTTYHNNQDEWYLIIPPSWRGQVSVRREDAVSGERTIVFSYIMGGDGPYEDFLKIYRLTGNNREELAARPGRTVLAREGVSVYAFEMLAAPNSYGLTFDATLIAENFRLIYSDWMS